MTSPQQAKHAQRLAAAEQWLRDSAWTALSEHFDYTEVIERAMLTFGYVDRRRAAALITKAARRLRGEFVSMRGERADKMVQISRAEYARLQAAAARNKENQTA